MLEVAGTAPAQGGVEGAAELPPAQIQGVEVRPKGDRRQPEAEWPAGVSSQPIPEAPGRLETGRDSCVGYEALLGLEELVRPEVSHPPAEQPGRQAAGGGGEVEGDVALDRAVDERRHPAGLDRAAGEAVEDRGPGQTLADPGLLRLVDPGEAAQVETSVAEMLAQIGPDQPVGRDPGGRQTRGDGAQLAVQLHRIVVADGGGDAAVEGRGGGKTVSPVTVDRQAQRTRPPALALHPVAAHSHGEEQFRREALKHCLEGGDSRLTTPGLAREEVDFGAGEDAEEETVWGDQAVAVDADLPSGGRGSGALQGRI